MQDTSTQEIRKTGFEDGGQLWDDGDTSGRNSQKLQKAGNNMILEAEGHGTQLSILMTCPHDTGF